MRAAVAVAEPGLQLPARLLDGVEKIIRDLVEHREADRRRRLTGDLVDRDATLRRRKVR
ncbi:hypothetical protein [Actinoallomurus soli]|uniref:hypothetical protein n=1 Tax=Actinoallomurus soli TaxID=2952535 RepID=UPI00209280FD|nr:hypothetical protein [Actinoallomurus soli]